MTELQMMTGLQGTGLQIERVAEVIVEFTSGPRRRGSGYLVAPATVLTAAHVVAHAARVEVRFDSDRPGERTIEARTAFAHPGIDLAVLTLAEPAGSAATVSYGRIGEHDAPLYCSAAGFPYFKLRKDPDNSRYRDLEHIRAICSPLTNRREGTLELRVAAPAAGADGSPWEGMSGAAVLSGGLLVGVVRQHQVNDGPGRLAASRVDRWAEKLSASELDALTGLLGTTIDPPQLPEASRTAAAGRPAAGLRALLHDLVPDHLDDRSAELADLLDFCAGAEPYRWLQGPPWAGKTTLAAWFALHPPPGVVPVCYFVTSRQAGQADSADFTEQLIRQLAEIAGRDPEPDGTPANRDQQRRQLLRDAAARLARDGATLLLVVDGLDEDRSERSSIAALLPERPPANLRVLVTSRPRPGVPADLPGGHPLRHCPVTRLVATPAALGIEHDARYELGQALAGDTLDREILGLLTAARGTLTLADLRELTGREQFVVRGRLDSPFGRILRERGEPAGDSLVRGYLFAHETLFAAALDAFGPDLAPYRERIHAWAQRYRAAGWPPDSPWYLLRQYGRLAVGEQDAPLATDLATDPRRHDRLRAVTGSDQPALAEIAAVRQLISRQATPDLARLAALAAAHGLVSRRNSALPPEVPVMIARLGQPRRAEGLARSMTGPGRLDALVGVAQVLAEAGDGRVGELVREVQRVAADVGLYDPPSEALYRRDLLAAGAVALATTGEGAAAVALVAAAAEEEFPWGEYEYEDEEAGDDVVPGVRLRRRDFATALSLAAVAKALRPRDPGLAERALAFVEAAVEDRPVIARIRLLAALADAHAEADPARAAELVERIDQEVDLALDQAPSQHSPAAALAWGADDLLPVHPAAALLLARAAAEHAATLLQPPTRSDDDRILPFLSTLTRSGQVAEAEALAGRIAADEDPADAPPWAEDPDPSHLARVRASIWGVVAPGWVHSGVPERARAVVEHAFAPGQAPAEVLAEVSRAFAEAGDLPEAGRWAERIPDPRQRARALCAMAEHTLAQDREQALRLAEEALQASFQAASRDQDRLSDRRLAALTDALAACADFTAAGREARSIAGPFERTWALAALAVRCHERGAGPAAGEFADQARQEGEDESNRYDWESRTTALLTAGEALAHLGPSARLTRVLDLLAESEAWPAGGYVAALGAHDPIRVGALLDGYEHQLRAAEDPEVKIACCVDLLAMAGRLDPPRTRRLLELLAQATDEDPISHPVYWGASDPSYQALAALLLQRDFPQRARLLREGVDEYVSGRGASSYEPRLFGTLALIHAAHGEWAQAEEWADNVWENPADRAATRCALAMTVGGLRGPALTTPLLADGWLAQVRACIEAFAPLPPADDTRLARARGLLTDVLLGDEWHHALPALAQLAPDAVLAVRDVVLDHRGGAA
ncbi:trypsin-like peptidase domain-containing protein [Kitasatospora viridis]|uniref:trypsin-like peptidase domain-containing protein n=1 Tax=Kitasatospora viridis TaxID=281105 RepID=UPI0031D17CC5